MENKYYTPSIEEFHVGFEYELWEEDICEDYSWKQHVFTLNDMAEILHPETKHHAGGLLSELEGEYIRVKYLDKEDIESLGFRYIHDDSEGDGNFRWFDFFTRDYIGLSYFSYIGENYKSLNYKLIIENKKNNSILFEGIIKNKSELQQVLKMIGVIGQ